jgi:hypothetical protein
MDPSDWIFDMLSSQASTSEDAEGWKELGKKWKEWSEEQAKFEEDLFAQAKEYEERTGKPFIEFTEDN